MISGLKDSFAPRSISPNPSFAFSLSADAILTTNRCSFTHPYTLPHRRFAPRLE